MFSILRESMYVSNITEQTDEWVFIKLTRGVRYGILHNPGNFMRDALPHKLDTNWIFVCFS